MSSRMQKMKEMREKEKLKRQQSKRRLEDALKKKRAEEKYQLELILVENGLNKQIFEDAKEMTDAIRASKTAMASNVTEQTMITAQYLFNYYDFVLDNYSKLDQGFDKNKLNKLKFIIDAYYEQFIENLDPLIKSDIEDLEVKSFSKTQLEPIEEDPVNTRLSIFDKTPMRRKSPKNRNPIPDFF